jgi:hypothetical protein
VYTEGMIKTIFALKKSCKTGKIYKKISSKLLKEGCTYLCSFDKKRLFTVFEPVFGNKCEKCGRVYHINKFYLIKEAK